MPVPSLFPAPTGEQDAVTALGHITVISHTIPGVTDLLDYCEHTTERGGFYIKTRDTGLELWGVGLTLRWTASSRAEFEVLQASLWQAIRSHPQSEDVYLLGGIGFSPTSGASEWDDFPYAQFVLPRMLFICKDDSTTLYQYGTTDPSRLLAPVTWGGDTGNSDLACRGKPLITKRLQHLPDRATWDTLVQSTLNTMQRGCVKKVVLARRTEVQLSSPTHPARIIRHLLAGQPSGVVPFAIAPHSIDTWFFGTTPELLFTATPEQIVSEALAGTGVVENSEGALAVCSPSELPHNLKNQNEHQFVVRSIAASLHEFCVDVRVPDSPSVLALTDLHHLRTPIVGIPRSTVNPFALLHTLHPTPAVCGTPTAAARKQIEGTEPFGRGWYAGAIGFINVEHSEFYVGIRSGLLKDTTLYLYSGVGIVPGSIPDEEWNELTSKQRPFERCMEPQQPPSGR